MDVRLQNIENMTKQKEKIYLILLFCLCLANVAEAQTNDLYLQEPIFWLSIFASIILFFLIRSIWQEYRDDKHQTPTKKENTFRTLKPDMNKRQRKKQEKKKTEKAKENPISVKHTVQTLRIKEWLVVHASVIGKSHTERGIPCQDSNQYIFLGKGWGIAVSCDGAGSAENSHLGSAFIAEKAVTLFKKIIEKEQWQIVPALPSQEQWNKIAQNALLKLRHALEEYALQENLPTESLACTIIVVIHTPLGILSTHIGDGRAGYCDVEAEWKPLITPWKGEEANQTVFITSQIWQEPQKYIESHVMFGDYTAFTLMSDGCERHSFELSRFDAENQSYEELNLPYPKFFNPLVQTLQNMHQNQVPQEEIQQKWKSFLEAGNEGLKNEPDDKTLILGIALT